MGILNEIKKYSKVGIADEERVGKMLQKLVQGGNSNLQLVVDFDRTLTRVHRNGQPLECSWGVLDSSEFVSTSYVQQAKEMRDKYLPIELDAHMTVAEKLPFMVEWYKEANRLLADVGHVKQKDFKRMVENSNVELREGTKIMMDSLLMRQVPVLVLSAGLGDMVNEILNVKEVNHPNVHTVSNFLDFNDKGDILGLKGEVIHVYNKNERSLKSMGGQESFLRDLEKRRNVILMGDSLGDVCMADGMDNPDVVLKIGFLNHGEDSETDKVRAKKYMDAYDIVLVDDQTMEVANFLLNAIDKS